MAGRIILILLSVVWVIAGAASQPVSAAEAVQMRATMYSDGLACPGDCDAHVVFAQRHNGTPNAFRPPLASRSSPEPCLRGQICVICFDASSTSCLEVMYRGSGPHEFTFDFTPAFFQKTCGKGDIPAALANECRGLQAAVKRHAYDQRINCIAAPDETACAALMAEAERLRAADAFEREACLHEGEEAYNERQTEPARRRSLSCNYEKTGTGGPNSKGKTWRRLLPGACRPGTFVGRDGLDCCSSELLAAAALHPECSPYFLRVE